MFIVIKDGNKTIRIDGSHYDHPGFEIRNDILYPQNGYYLKNNRTKLLLKPGSYCLYQRVYGGEIIIDVYENDIGFNEYHLYENKPFILAHNSRANIVAKDPLMYDHYLLYKDQILNTNYDELYVNNEIYKGQPLENGDDIWFFNFHFIYYEEFFYMNSFLVDNKLPLKELKEELVVYDEPKIKTNNYYQNKLNELEIEKIKEPQLPRNNKQRSLFLLLGPSLTMSMAMLAVAILNIYKQPNINEITILTYCLMPLTMLLSGVLWPIISRFVENHQFKKEYLSAKKKYLAYLNKYEQRLITMIIDHTKQYLDYYFDAELKESKLFYITSKSSEFLKISIGKYVKEYEHDFAMTSDDDINEYLSRFKYRLANMEDFPYFLDLKKIKTISFVCREKEKIIKKILLELACKYDYDEFYLGIYARDLNVYREFYDIPEIIYKKTRLTLNKASDLQTLNNEKLDKPMIIFLCDNCDFVFNNEKIKVLYFTDNFSDLYKDSEIVVEYQKNSGLIYSDKKIVFSYDDPNIDYSIATKRLADYQKLDILHRVYSFHEVYWDIDLKNNYLKKQEGLLAEFAIYGHELLSFDLHESKNGPHGLIGGTTGSGKSELLVSLLLSLCLRYNPDYLKIILIDYKGGGIADSLSADDMLPHIIASVDNLVAEVFERLIVMIDRECKKRQEAFKALSKLTSLPIMNIDAYLENDPIGHGLANMAHLLIVVDEFAELKKENPSLIKELVSFSRIGRSLGLHLILATQRPSGIIDDEIWSNSRFKIALKVFSEKDSNDIIKVPDAAYLKDPGEFYLKVDDNLIKAQSIYGKSDINNNSDHSVALLDNKLNIIKKQRIINKKPLLETTYYVSKINELCKELGYQREYLKLERPMMLSRKELEGIYGKSDHMIVGEIDDYLRAYRGLLVHDISDSCLIYSSRSKELFGILNNIKEECIVIGNDYYCKDNIADSLVYQDDEDIRFLFKKLIDEKERTLVLLIEDLGRLLSFNDNYQELFYQLLRRNNEHIKIIAITKNSQLNFKLLNTFKKKYAIEISDKQDLLNLFSMYGNYRGNSFYFDDRLISFVPCMIEELLASEKMVKKYLAEIPQKIIFYKKDSYYLLAYDKQTREEVFIEQNEKILISSFDDELLDPYKNNFTDLKNVIIKKYDDTLIKEHFKKILWLGEGLLEQRLFFAEKDIQSNEAFYYSGSKGRVLRYLDE